MVMVDLCSYCLIDSYGVSLGGVGGVGYTGVWGWGFGELGV